MKELFDILMVENIEDSIINNLDILLELIPELKYTIGYDQMNPNHHLDVFDHTLYALSLSPIDFDVRLSLLLHDISKPFQNQVDGEIKHYRMHPLVSANMAVNILNRLGFDDEYIEYIWNLIRLHDYPISIKEIVSNIEFEKTRFLIQFCDALAHNPQCMDKRIEYIKKTSKLINQEEEKMKKYGR